MGFFKFADLRKTRSARTEDYSSQEVKRDVGSGLYMRGAETTQHLEMLGVWPNTECAVTTALCWEAARVGEPLQRPIRA